MKVKDTSWEKVAPWYKKTVGLAGSYYHEHVIFPNLLRLLELKPRMSLLDFGCGQGVLARAIPKEIKYVGVDKSRLLLDEAIKLDKNPEHRYLEGDITMESNMLDRFDRVAMVLSLQNVDRPFKLIQSAAKLMRDSGKLVMVLNHPSFRIPQNSDWLVDKEKRIQKRVVSGYLSPLEIKIESRPFDKVQNEVSLSYHYPMSAYSEMLFDNGMVIEKIEEWISDKKSEGGMAQMEDRARREFPLFMAIVAIKV